MKVRDKVVPKKSFYSLYNYKGIKIFKVLEVSEDNKFIKLNNSKFLFFPTSDFDFINELKVYEKK